MTIVRKISKKFLGHSMVRNSLWMLGGQGLGLIAQAAYFVVIARLLGSVEYGIFVGVAASVSMVSQYGAFGSGLLFLRHVSPDHKRFASYWGNILLSTSLFGSLLVAGLTALSPWLLRNTAVRMVLLVAVGDCICGQLMTAISQVFQTFERMRYTAVINLASSCLRLVLASTMLFSLHHATAMQWAMGSLTISATAALVSVGLVTLHFGLPTFDLRLMFHRAWEGFVFAVSGSTTSVYNDVDKALLAHYGMNAANGVYTMAYRVIDIGTLPIRSVHGAAFPKFFRCGGKEGGMLGTVPFARKLLKRTAWLGLGTAAGCFLLAPLVPAIVGKAFTPSVGALRWLCLIPLLRCLHLSAGDAMAGAGKQSVRLLFQALAAALNIGLNLWLIPRHGWMGAAWASLATDGSLGVSMWAAALFMTRTKPKAVPEPSQAVGIGVLTQGA